MNAVAAPPGIPLQSGPNDFTFDTLLFCCQSLLEGRRQRVVAGLFPGMAWLGLPRPVLEESRFCAMEPF